VDFVSYIRPELSVLIAVLYTIGLLMKSSTGIKDKWIPLWLGLIGIVLGLAYVLGTSVLDRPEAYFSAIFSGITQGILCAAAAVYANQLYKQAGKDE
jgi:1,4-dihydroxy-2-naphthoate octaprenyltransferase